MKLMNLTAEQNDLLISFVTKKDGDVSHSSFKPSDLAALQQADLIWHDGKTVTDRGKAYAIVHLNIPTSHVMAVKPTLKSFLYVERHTLDKIFNDDEKDIIFHAKFKVMLDYDMFNENHAFRDPSNEEGYKMTNLVFLELARNANIDLQKLLQYMHVPNLTMIQTHQDLVNILEQAKKIAGWS